MSRKTERIWLALSTALSLIVFLSTVQAIPNGSQSPYTTDVGEIQNALPRWGTIHWTGYPVYTFLGSLFTTVLRWVGVPPALGTSLFSTLWGVVSVGLMVLLLYELDVSEPLAALGGVIFAVSTSMWMDASLAEVHTLTVAFTLATFLFALRFKRTGERRDLLLLALTFSQGVIHQRAVIFLAPAVVVFTVNRWQPFLQGLLPSFAISLLAPLTYLYLPLRVRMGADWTFGAPGTWQGVVTMLFDNRAERIVAWPESAAEWLERIGRAFHVTAIDLPMALLALGLLGLLVLLAERRWQESIGLTLAWIPYILLTGAIWIGRVGDAQLAAHLPVTLLAALGLALLVDRLARFGPKAHVAGVVGLAAVFGLLFVLNRPVVLAVTRDPSAEATIALAEQVAPPPFDEPATFMALWGHDYWSLAYAQKYQDRLPGLALVDHNADFRAVLAQDHRLLTFDHTFYSRPLSWWDGRLERIYLSSVAPHIVEIALEPPVSDLDLPPSPDLDLENGLWIRSVDLAWHEDGALVLALFWQAMAPVEQDYSVAVHLVSHDPPRGPENVLSQADQLHPVDGLYPTSRWEEGEIVREHYRIPVPEGTEPVAVRVGQYYVDASGGFVNTPWLSIPVPPR